MSGIERRQYQRFAVHPSVRVRFPGSTSAAEIVDVSEGGFGVRTAALLSFDSSSEAVFFTLDGTWSAALPVRVAFCATQPAKTGQHEGTYFSGFAFRSPEAPAVRHAILALLDRAVPISA